MLNQGCLTASKLCISLDKNNDTGLHKLNIEKCLDMPIFSDVGSNPDGYVSLKF